MSTPKRDVDPRRETLNSAKLRRSRTVADNPDFLSRRSSSDETDRVGIGISQNHGSSSGLLGTMASKMTEIGEGQATSARPTYLRSFSATFQNAVIGIPSVKAATEISNMTGVVV